MNKLLYKYITLFPIFILVQIFVLNEIIFSNLTNPFLYITLIIKDLHMVEIFHNPRCSKSRETLNILKNKGIDHTVIEYLKTPLSTQQIKNIFEILKIKPSQAVRKNESEFKENNLSNYLDDDDKLISFMVKYPKIIERPIVINGKDAVIARPPDKVLNIL